MKKAWLYLLFFVCALIPGCGMQNGSGNHELVLENVTRNSISTYTWAFGDIQGDWYEHFIVASPSPAGYNFILVKDQTGKHETQLTYPHKFGEISVLRDQVNRESWLFFSLNDQKMTYLTGARYTWENDKLKKELRNYEPIERLPDVNPGNKELEWVAYIIPSFIQDIDDDGRLELVCRTNDGFHANPRGLVVYDFESGKIKWRFDLNTNLTPVLFDDFDGDGSREFVCGNYALKNSREVKQGMDDFHGWLMVVSSRGELLYHEKAFDDFGAVVLSSDDIDQDGRPEILALYRTWGSSNYPNSVNIFKWNGSKLIRTKFREYQLNFRRNFHEYFYSILDGVGTKRFLIPVQGSPMIVLDQNLHPVRHEIEENITNIWDVEDIDRDGSKEILAETDCNKFLVLDKYLKKKAELDNPFVDRTSYSASIVQAGKDRNCRVAICSPGEVRYYSYERISPFQALAGYFDDLTTYLLVLVTFLLILLLFVFNHRNQVLSTAINHFPLGIIIMASRDRITHINKYILETLHEDTRIPTLKKAKKLSVIMPELQRILVGFISNKAQEFSTSITLGKSQARHEVHMYKLHGLSRRYLIVLKPDIKASQEYETKLSWAETARRLSHNVRRHITNVLLALKPLEENGDNGEHKKYREYAEIIRTEMDKIKVFSHAFQRFTELEDYDLKLQNLIPSVEKCVEKSRIPANIELMKNWDLKSVEAYIEPLRFEEALYNLINNALEAMPGGGVLQLSVRSFPGHTRPEGRLSVLVEVEDNGRGIPEKYKDDIWQPFFSTKESGTGIGIPETRKIVESMSGAMDIQSEEGVGTVVSIWLKGEKDG